MQRKILILLVMACFAGCSNNQTGQTGSQRAVAKINDYTVTVDDFNHETGYLRPVFRSISSIPPMELKLGVLDEMINRQILLQEAQRMNIDKDPEFMRQIENFWRLSLIKELLKQKIAEIQGSTTVSDEEVSTEYVREKDQTGSLKPLKEMYPLIKKVLFQRKLQAGVQAWEDALKTRAVVKRYYAVLNSIPIDIRQGGENAQGK